MPTRTGNPINFWNIEDNAFNWQHYYNANMDLLNNVALKLQGLADVDIQTLKDKSVLKFNGSTNRWQITHRRT
jgi:hypothetical protein